MGRPIRLDYPGAVFHASARGDQGRRIFGGDADRRRFPETLGGACQKNGLARSGLHVDEQSRSLLSPALSSKAEEREKLCLV
jgi:hypothetical protein